jgi:pyridoxal phosphate enzyme (YggS family)
MPDIRANVERVQDAIDRACRRSGRSAGDVLLIAVSKTVDLERIKLAIAAGVPALGENRVQEAKDKVAALGRPVPWHLIGSLQTNKARDAIRLFDWIHSVDRVELARELARRAGQAGRPVEALLEVNVGEEQQKGGVRPSEVKTLLDAVRGLDGIHVRGLMTIPPVASDPEESRGWFRRLRELRDDNGLEHLSMGMSADFEVAIEEGATMVRVGTAIFGPRQGRGQVPPARATRPARDAASSITEGPE